MAKSTRFSFFKSLRFYTSFASVWIMNLGVFGLSLKKVCAPGFNCHGCPAASFACPVGTMTFGFSWRTFPALAVGLVATVGVVFGRLVCGFFCPFGFLQELLYRVPTPKVSLTWWREHMRWTRWGKYAALALLVVAFPLALGFDLSTEWRLYYCRICPNGTLTATPFALGGASSEVIYGAAGGLAVKVSILFAFLIGMVLVSRVFCRTFCPLGAAYALMSPFALWRVRVDHDACVMCGVCNRVCPVDLDVVKEAGGPECISCGACIGACPKGAISRVFGLRPGHAHAMPSSEKV